MVESKCSFKSLKEKTVANPFQKPNVESALPLSYTADAYDRVDTRLIVALILTIASIIVEYCGLLGGITTFMPGTALFCEWKG